MQSAHLQDRKWRETGSKLAHGAVVTFLGEGTGDGLVPGGGGAGRFGTRGCFCTPSGGVLGLSTCGGGGRGGGTLPPCWSSIASVQY